MSDQKDNQNKTLYPYGQGSTNFQEKPDSKASYEFAHKKTEKLVTALYMITDCMDSGDALKGKLRGLGVDLLSDIYKLSILSPIEKHGLVTGVLIRISEITSFIEISHTIGFVSEMNANILKKEFGLLVTELESYQSKNHEASVSPESTTNSPRSLFENQKNTSFILSSQMFEVEKKLPQISQISKDNYLPKRTVNELSFKTPTLKNSTSHFTKRQDSSELNDSNTKKERSLKIMSLIKDNQHSNGQEGVSIKDISQAFTECSEKTIQRELNALVVKGQIHKTGAKRWSRYSL